MVRKVCLVKFGASKNDSTGKANYFLCRDIQVTVCLNDYIPYLPERYMEDEFQIYLCDDYPTRPAEL